MIDKQFGLSIYVGSGIKVFERNKGYTLDSENNIPFRMRPDDSFFASMSMLAGGEWSYGITDRIMAVGQLGLSTRGVGESSLGERVYMPQLLFGFSYTPY